MCKASCHLRMVRLLPLSLLICAVIGVTPAAARPVGHNGQIAFGRYDPVLDALALYRVNPDGTGEQQLLPLFGGLPHWSPDGTQIVSPVTESGPGAAITNADDGSTVQFPEATSNLDPFCYLWSPNGQRIACEGESESDRSLRGIYTIRSSDGGGLTRITSGGGGGDHPGDYSPNGKHLVYLHFAPCCDLPFDEWIAQSGVFVVNVKGAGVRKIAPCCTSLPSWSPQGNEIVFSRRTNDVHSSIWIVHSDGSGLHEVNVQVPPGEYSCGAQVSDPQFNPDNDPTVGGCFDPSWSPDGKKIIFVRGDDALGDNIYTVNVDGSGLTQVTHGGADQFNGGPPDWGVHPLAR
jgi:Tol biopolymer transport system component